MIKMPQDSHLCRALPRGNVSRWRSWEAEPRQTMNAECRWAIPRSSETDYSPIDGSQTSCTSSTATSSKQKILDKHSGVVKIIYNLRERTQNALSLHLIIRGRRLHLQRLHSAPLYMWEVCMISVIVHMHMQRNLTTIDAVPLTRFHSSCTSVRDQGYFSIISLPLFIERTRFHKPSKPLGHI